MAKPSPVSSAPARLLVLELWGIGDVALALPFLRTASAHAHVTLLAKPHAAPLLARFAPTVEHLSLTAPWTAFRSKYRLHRWPWRMLLRTRRELRSRHFDAGASARHDPRDHALLALSGVEQRLGFPRAGSGTFLTRKVPPPAIPHRSQHWHALARAFGWEIAQPAVAPRVGRRVVIHPGAGQPVRRWPRERFEVIATRLRAANWTVEFISETDTDLDRLIDTLTGADRFIGNDSGPGHLAALLGVPTFTIFGPQLPELFAPQHPDAAWIEGAPCRFKPCFDACRFPQPLCLLNVDVETVWKKIHAWLPH